MSSSFFCRANHSRRLTHISPLTNKNTQYRDVSPRLSPAGHIICSIYWLRVSSKSGKKIEHRYGSHPTRHLKATSPYKRFISDIARALYTHTRTPLSHTQLHISHTHHTRIACTHHPACILCSPWVNDKRPAANIQQHTPRTHTTRIPLSAALRHTRDSGQSCCDVLSK